MGFLRSLCTLATISCLSLVLFFLSNCSPASYHMQQVTDPTEKVTVGKVQKEIRIGMSGSEVAEILGSPNIVSSDEKRREVWIYDKMSRISASSENVGGVSVLLLGAMGRSGAVSSSQRTLTVIIKFDNEKKVRDFAYHYSSF